MCLAEIRDVSGLLIRSNQKDKEDLEEISTELELADEDDKVPYVRSTKHSRSLLMPRRYKIGDSFFNLPVPEVQELLTAAVERIDTDVSGVEDKLAELIKTEREQA